MFFTFSFPVEEETASVEIRNQIKRINRFFRIKADLSGKSRSFGIQLLTPNNIRLKRLSIDNGNYYLFCKFFNPQREEQQKLALFLKLGTDEEITYAYESDVCCLSRISSLPLQQVTFYYKSKSIIIEVELADKYRTDIHSFLETLSLNSKNC